MTSKPGIHVLMGIGLLTSLIVMNVVIPTNSQNFATVPAELLQKDITSPKEFIISAATPFTEAIPSWTGTVGDGQVRILLKPFGDSQKWYSLGTWSQTGERTSINDQKDEMATVLTDTIRFAEPQTKIVVRIEPVAGKSNLNPSLKTLHLSLNKPLDEEDMSIESIPPLNVPQRCQGDYPNGGVLCSPTSVSMILAYWSDVLTQPDLNHDVPQVQAGVYDPAWKGTGNWPFNVAYGGSLPGMTGAVTRMRNIGDLELWLKAKVPVACSISYALLKGEEKKRVNDGHLVVLVGFDSAGHPIFNDPGRKEVRWTYQRKDFEKAWKDSGRTVYLIYPDWWRTPAEEGPWPQNQSSLEK